MPWYLGALWAGVSSQCNWIGWKFAGNTSTVAGSSALYPLGPNGATSQENLNFPDLTPPGVLPCPYTRTYLIALADLGALYQAMIDDVANEGPWTGGDNRSRDITALISVYGIYVNFELQYGINRTGDGTGGNPFRWSVGESLEIHFNAGGGGSTTLTTTAFTPDFTSAPLGFTSGLVLDAANDYANFDWFFTVTTDSPFYETNVVFDDPSTPTFPLFAAVGSSTIPSLGDAFRGMAIFEGDYTSADWPALLALWESV